MAVKKKQGRFIANSQPERRSFWKPLNFEQKERRPGMFEIIKPVEKKPVRPPLKSFDSTGRVAVPIPEESDEVKVRRRLSDMNEDMKRKSVPPPPPLRTVREIMRINKAERELYDGEISLIEDDDYLELSSEDIEEMEPLRDSFKERSFFKTLLRDIEGLVNKLEKEIDGILKL